MKETKKHTLMGAILGIIIISLAITSFKATECSTAECFSSLVPLMALLILTFPISLVWINAIDFFYYSTSAMILIPIYIVYYAGIGFLIGKLFEKKWKKIGWTLTTIIYVIPIVSLILISIAGFLKLG